MNKEKKIAICYYGLSYNINNLKNSNADSVEINYESLTENHKQTLWLPNNADIFIHTWASDKELDIKNTYKPKLSLFENQKKFDEEANDICVNNSLEFYHRRSHLMSRFYSNKMVINLKKQFEKTHGFMYDLVMVTRFDAIYRGDWNINKLDNSKFYVSGEWPCDYKKYLPDIWFISNSFNIDILGNVYDEMKLNFYDPTDELPNDWNAHSIVRRHLVRNNLINNIQHFKKHYTESNIFRFDSAYNK